MKLELVSIYLFMMLSICFQTASHSFGQDDESLQVRAWFKVKQGTSKGVVYVHAQIAEGYHTYAQDHVGNERPTEIAIADISKIRVLGSFVPVEPPYVEYKNGKASKSFEHEVTWEMPFEMVPELPAEQLVLGIDYMGQVCAAGSCKIPERKSLLASFAGYERDLLINENLSEIAGPPQDQTHVVESNGSAALDSFTSLYDADSKIKYEKLDGSSGTGTFWAALVGAFLGGMLLNLMPCVFPVLGLKVLGFVEQAGNDPKKIRLHGFAFAGGLVVSMWVLAGAILMLKEFWGQEVSWGQQMGNPFFVGGMVVLLFVFGLNLAGVFELGLFLTNVGGSGSNTDGYVGSFISGVLTTLVATPCSGPFLGAAMGYTLAQPPAIAMFLFTVFGLGIAMPYLALSFMPKLIHMLPPPGGWMETFKKLMCFTLFAAAAFFAKSFGAQTGNAGLSWLLMALCVISLAAFFYGKYSPAYVVRGKRWIWGWGVPTLIAAVGIWMYLDAAQLKAPRLAASEDAIWQPWTPGKVEELLAENKPVWVDYTADW